MQITVADYSEYIDKYFAARGDVLEIIFSSNHYEDGVFNISCDGGFKQVTMRGQAITTLVDSPVNVCGDDITIKNFLFDSRRISDAVLRARPKNGVTISDCVWTRAFLSEEPGSSILHVEPLKYIFGILFLCQCHSSPLQILHYLASQIPLQRPL